MGRIINRNLYLETVPSFNRRLILTAGLYFSRPLKIASRGFYYQFWGVKNSRMYSEKDQSCGALSAVCERDASSMGGADSHARPVQQLYERAAGYGCPVHSLPVRRGDAPVTLFLRGPL